MKYFILIIVLVILAGCGITEPILDQEDEQYYTLEKGNKVVVCHKNSEGNFNTIEISEAALEAHLNHGDGQPGDAVPDKEGFIFTEDCDCIADNACPGIPTITYEGKTYNTVQIGNQCWLKENLNVGTRIAGSSNQTNNSTIEKYCYDDYDGMCDAYGGLYQWDEAMQYSSTEGSQGICPTGWHIPTYAEFLTLSTSVSGDGNAFSALLAGYRGLNGLFDYGYSTYFWSSTEYGAPGAAYSLYWNSTYSDIGLSNGYKGFGFSVRCLKD